MPIYDEAVDNWSHGHALLVRLHLADCPQPVWLDGVYDSPPANDQGDPYGLEIRTMDERGDPCDHPVVAFASADEAVEFAQLLIQCAEGVWEGQGVMDRVQDWLSTLDAESSG